jgi:hypothetical protein
MKVPMPRKLDRRFVSARMLWPGIRWRDPATLCSATGHIVPDLQRHRIRALAIHPTRLGRRQPD